MTDVLEELLSLTQEEQEEWEDALSAAAPYKAAAKLKERSRELSQSEEEQTQEGGQQARSKQRVQAAPETQTGPVVWSEQGEERSGPELEKQVHLAKEGLERKKLRTQTGGEAGERTSDPIIEELHQDGPTLGSETGHSVRSSALARQMERVSRLGTAVPSLPLAAAGERGGLSLPKPGEQIAPQDQVRQVDRAFERDARRYDCGFTLF